MTDIAAILRRRAARQKRAVRDAVERGPAARGRTDTPGGDRPSTGRTAPYSASGGETGPHEVYSKLFGERVLLVADGAAIPETEKVVYTRSEIEVLKGLSPEARKRVHLVKKALDGEVLEPEKT